MSHVFGKKHISMHIAIAWGCGVRVGARGRGVRWRASCLRGQCRACWASSSPSSRADTRRRRRRRRELMLAAVVGAAVVGAIWSKHCG